MNVVSSRQATASQEFNDKLKSLRRRRFFLEENLKTSRENLEKANNEEDYRKIGDHIKVLQMDIAELTDEIDDMEGSTHWRITQLQEINNHGFSISGHAVNQYNARFKPYLTRDQLIEFLKRLGLREKLNGNVHQLIQLRPNFRVAVERKVVTTFKYDDNYYQGPNTPKFDLGAL